MFGHTPVSPGYFSGTIHANYISATFQNPSRHLLAQATYRAGDCDGRQLLRARSLKFEAAY